MACHKWGWQATACCHCVREHMWEVEATGLAASRLGQDLESADSTSGTAGRPSLHEARLPVSSKASGESHARHRKSSLQELTCHRMLCLTGYPHLLHLASPSAASPPPYCSIRLNLLPKFAKHSIHNETRYSIAPPFDRSLSSRCCSTRYREELLQEISHQSNTTKVTTIVPRNQSSKIMYTTPRG